MSVKSPFSFVSDGYDESTFIVAEFSGESGLSTLSSFNILLVSRDDSIDPSVMIFNRAELRIESRDQNVVHSGKPVEFTRLYRNNDLTFYRLLLRPTLFPLTLSGGSRIFVNKSTTAIIKDILTGNSMDTGLIDFHLMAVPPDRNYTCQYGEHDFNFISRLLEKTGMYYYFSEDDGRDIMKVTDTMMGNSSDEHCQDIVFSAVSGLEFDQRHRVVRSFSRHVRRTPSFVNVRNYEYEKPSKYMHAAHAPIPSDGNIDHFMGGEIETYIFGDNLRSGEEADQAASFLSEMAVSGMDTYQGKSGIPDLRPGFQYHLSSHFDQNLNREYLVVSVRERGVHPAFRQKDGKDGSRELATYTNTFTAISADVQYRAPLRTPAPKVSGVIHATVAADAGDEYAELDDQGRYRVRFPFDPEPDKGIGDWHWIRRAQPYGGEQYGLHCPLHDGAEVLVSFAGGDPDRPVIVGGMSNPSNASPVTSSNQTQNVWRTAGGNEIVMDDDENARRISVSTPKENSWYRLGEVPSDDTLEGSDDDWGPLDLPEAGFASFTNANLKTKAGKCNFSFVAGDREEHVGDSCKRFLTMWNVVFRLDESTTQVKNNRIEVHPVLYDERSKQINGAQNRIALVAQHVDLAVSKVEMLKNKISLLNNEIEHYTENSATLEMAIELINKSTETIETKSRRMKMLIEVCNKRFPEIGTATKDSVISITAAQDLTEKVKTANENLLVRVEAAKSLDDGATGSLTLGDLVTVVLSSDVKVI